jgi:hypothetical protein
MDETAVLRFSVLCRNFSLPVGPCSVPAGLARSLSAGSRPAGVCDLLSRAAQTVLSIYTLFSIHSAQETQHKPVTTKVAAGGVLYFVLRKCWVRLPVGSLTIPTADFRVGSPPN